MLSPVSPLRSPVHSRQMPANAKSGRLSSSANQCVTLGRVSVHSQNDVAGTRHRHSAFSHPPQYGDFRLGTLVTGTVPRFGGGGNPHRIIANSRSPSRAVRTTGAKVSGKMPGRLGRLPVRSRITRKARRIASWLRVML